MEAHYKQQKNIMKTFINQIKKNCKNYYYFNIGRTMQIKDEFEDTKVAIVAIREKINSELYYTIFFQYNTMKKADNYGQYISLYNEQNECIYNAYIDACEEFAKFAI